MQVDGTMTVGQLVEALQKLDQSAKLYSARMAGVYQVHVAPVVWTAEKDGKVLLLDPDTYRTLVVAKAKPG